MTLDAAIPELHFTVAGIGPYPTEWPYLAGTLSAGVMVDGVLQDLPGLAWGAVPEAAEISGDIFLTPEAAAEHAGREVIIRRDTLSEQGWEGQQSARERGLERQLDRQTMTMQEMRAQNGRTLRLEKAVPATVIGDPGTTLVWDGERLVPGPSASAIAGAAVDAERAKEEADRAKNMADRVDLGALDQAVAATGEDRVQTGLDRVAAGTFAGVAEVAAGTAATEANAQIAPNVTRSEDAADRAENARDAALGAAGWDQSVIDEAARLALTGLPDDWRVYQIEPAPGRIWRWDGADWADGGPNPLAAKAEKITVDRPIWTGLRSGWPDPFFRRTVPGAPLAGRDRWYGNNAIGDSGAGWSSVASAVFPGARALRRTGGYNNTSYGGPVIYLDDLGAAPGETITVYALIVGAGDTAYGAYRWLNAAGAEIGNGLMVNEAGGNPLVTDTTPKWLRMSVTVPANAARVAIWNYCLAGSSGFDLVALWAFRGGTSAGPAWPSVEDDYFSVRDTEIEARLSDAEANAAPHVVWQSPRGDAEMVGDATYATKVIGFYEVMDDAGKVNAIDLRMWPSNLTTDVEWRVFVRPNSTAFNPSVETPAASGTIPAGSIPVVNAEHRLRLPSELSVQAGQRVFVFYRAADDSNINCARWLYDAGVSPARHAFAIGTSNGWDQTWAATGPTIGYGQPAIRLSYQSEWGDGIEAQIADLREQVDQITPPDQPVFTIPAIINAVVGVELNLYHDAIFSGHSDGLGGLAAHSVSIIGPRGQNMQRCFRLTPVTGDIGTHAFTAKAWDAAGNLVATRPFSIRVRAAIAPGSAKTVLMLGDSLTGPGDITSTARTNLAGMGGTTPTFVGSQGGAPNKHEGRGGKSFGWWAGAGGVGYRFTVSGVTSVGIGATYTVSGVTYTVTEVNISGGTGTIATTGASAPPASGTLTKAAGTGDATIAFSASATEPGNPLWSGGALDVAAYRSAQSIGSVIDAVTIQLGINDVFGETVLSSFAGFVASAKAIANAFLADNPACRVVVELPTISGNTSDGFAANYGASQSREVFEVNLFGLRLALIEALDGAAHHANVSVGSVGLQVDRYYGYARVNTTEAARIAAPVERHSNGVHPNIDGYRQCGDGITADIIAALS